MADETTQGPPRPQSAMKQLSIREQIAEYVNKLIKPSQALHYSQVLMVPKPNGTWRFCIDFRWLNICTTGLGWPIPNIRQMIDRIGLVHAQRKPGEKMIYGKFDLTQGYFQMSVHPDSQIYTAFITFMGTFWVFAEKR
jgi:hypothetical protein